jgi:hypothetical protein
MVDCKWNDRENAPSHSAPVSLGQKYTLASGLMEITYDTGARVILQGPVTYKIESSTGGYLSVGKITARVEKITASGPWSAKGELLVQYRHPQANDRVPLFSVRTPTTTVTDLGTEFSVEVKPNQASNVEVMSGMVEVERKPGDGIKPFRVRVVAGEELTIASDAAAPQRTTMPRTSGRSTFGVNTLAGNIKDSRRSCLTLHPTALVANSYHCVWDPEGKLLANNGRDQAFLMATDGIFGRGEGNSPPMSSFDTLSRNSDTDFVGLIYDRAMRFDRIKLFLGGQTKDGGSWSETPRLFVLKHHVDTNQTLPETDHANWRELSLRPLYGASFKPDAGPGPGEVLEIPLAGFCVEDRTGFGWAIGGVKGNGRTGFVSVTELRAYGIPIPSHASDKGGQP